MLYKANAVTEKLIVRDWGMDLATYQDTYMDIPDVTGISDTLWRWINEDKRIFESVNALNLEEVPTLMGGVYAVAKSLETGLTLTGSLSENGRLVVDSVELTPDVDYALLNCDEDTEGRICVINPIEYITESNIEEWISGIPEFHNVYPIRPSTEFIQSLGE